MQVSVQTRDDPFDKARRSCEKSKGGRRWIKSGKVRHPTWKGSDILTIIIYDLLVVSADIIG
jgi:hypothetical protein